jgi:RNA polymerase sigma-70 factor (ECF subfamily)
MPDSDLDRANLLIELLVRHRHALYAFIAKQLVHHDDVEDTFQRTCMVLWRKLDEFDTSGSFFGWASGIAHNEVRNLRASQRRNRLNFDPDLIDLLASEASVESDLSDARLAALRSCLESMSDRQRDLLRRCYDGASSVAEVAESLGRQRDALYKQLSRIRESLRECIRVQLAERGGHA